MFQSISASACCVTAVLTPDNCVDELERVIREALRQSMPAYIVISELHGLDVPSGLDDGHSERRQHIGKLQFRGIRRLGAGEHHDAVRVGRGGLAAR